MQLFLILLVFGECRNRNHHYHRRNTDSKRHHNHHPQSSRNSMLKLSVENNPHMKPIVMRSIHVQTKKSIKPILIRLLNMLTDDPDLDDHTLMPVELLLEQSLSHGRSQIRPINMLSYAGRYARLKGLFDRATSIQPAELKTLPTEK